MLLQVLYIDLRLPFQLANQEYLSNTQWILNLSCVEAIASTVSEWTHKFEDGKVMLTVILYERDDCNIGLWAF